MLDLDHPQTPLVFAASVQLDMILDYSKKITLSGTTGRRFMLEVIRPAFAALRWLNAERFGASPTITTGIDELERGVETLVGMPLTNPGHRGGPAPQCPACGGQPTTPNQYDRTAYCPTCLRAIMPGLTRLRSRQGFGTDAI